IRNIFYAETTLELLADLEHEFRISRHSVWLGFAARKHEPDLQVPARRGKLASVSLARWPNHGVNHSTHHRFDERSHLEQAWSSPSLFSRGGDSRQCCALLHARFVRSVDGCGTALDTRREHQYHDGTVSRVCRRQAAGRTTHPRLRDAEFFHRHRPDARECFALLVHDARRSGRNGEWNS